MGVTAVMTKGRGAWTDKHGSNCNNDKRKGAGTGQDGSNSSNDKRKAG